MLSDSVCLNIIAMAATMFIGIALNLLINGVSVTSNVTVNVTPPDNEDDSPDVYSTASV